MKVSININTGNSAFQDNYDETEDILKTVVARITQYDERFGNIYDSNGNMCGNYKVTGK